MQSTENKLIQLLETQGKAFISGQKISDELNISRSAVWKRMKALEKAGYQIEARRNVGYRLLKTSDELNEYSLKWGLQTEWLGHQVIHKSTTESTQIIAHEIAEKSPSAAHGTVVIADEQTESVGRQRREWLSTKDKGIWMSFILKPNIYPYEAPQFTLLTATVLADVFHHVTKVTPKIKWPNDIFIKDRKISGILTEMKAEQDDVQYVIIGIGINVNQTVEDFPEPLNKRATSLRMETEKSWSRIQIVQEILQGFEEQYNEYLEEGFSGVKRKWESYGYRMGRKIKIRSGKDQWLAKFIGVAEDGALLTEGSNGEVQKIYSAEIDWYGGDQSDVKSE